MSQWPLGPLFSGFQQQMWSASYWRRITVKRNQCWLLVDDTKRNKLQFPAFKSDVLLIHLLPQTSSHRFSAMLSQCHTTSSWLLIHTATRELCHFNVINSCFTPFDQMTDVAFFCIVFLDSLKRNNPPPPLHRNPTHSLLISFIKSPHLM